jgi:hypothetical protein
VLGEDVIPFVLRDLCQVDGLGHGGAEHVVEDPADLARTSSWPRSTRSTAPGLKPSTGPTPFSSSMIRFARFVTVELLARILPQPRRLAPPTTPCARIRAVRRSIP